LEKAEWRESHMYHKPSSLKRAPSWLWPGHLPRIQWMLWFCGFSKNLWTCQLMRRLLQGSPQVLVHFSDNPFPGKPPKMIRFTWWKYSFTSWEEGWSTGCWWTRQFRGLYYDVVQLDEAGELVKVKEQAEFTRDLMRLGDGQDNTTPAVGRLHSGTQQMF